MRAFLSASLLVIVVGVGCDRQQRAVAKSQPVDYFAKKRECLELAVKREARDDQAMAKTPPSPDLSSGLMQLHPEKCYVPSMNTCIYESGFLNFKNGETTMTVEDLMTGRELTYATFVNPTPPAYKHERDRLFALCAQ
jgi:hypothetical protein